MKIEANIKSKSDGIQINLSATPDEGAPIKFQIAGVNSLSQLDTSLAEICDCAADNALIDKSTMDSIHLALGRLRKAAAKILPETKDEDAAGGIRVQVGHAHDGVHILLSYEDEDIDLGPYLEAKTADKARTEVEAVVAQWGFRDPETLAGKIVSDLPELIEQFWDTSVPQFAKARSLKMSVVRRMDGVRISASVGDTSFRTTQQPPTEEGLRTLAGELGEFLTSNGIAPSIAIPAIAGVLASARDGSAEGSDFKLCARSEDGETIQVTGEAGASRLNFTLSCPEDIPAAMTEVRKWVDGLDYDIPGDLEESLYAAFEEMKSPVREVSGLIADLLRELPREILPPDLQRRKDDLTRSEDDCRKGMECINKQRGVDQKNHADKLAAEADRKATMFEVEKNTIISRVKQSRVELDSALQNLKTLRKDIQESNALDFCKDAGEVIANCKISERAGEDAIMRLGMVLKNIGSNNPYPNSYNPNSTAIEPTADGLKL